MITVVVLSAVLMMLGGGMYFVAAREHRMTQADFVGGQAFYFAEGGIENAIDIINYAGTETQLIRPRPDQSSNGVGYLMDPVPANRQNPTDPIEMNIGVESYRVWVDTVDASGNPCDNCGLNLTTTNPAYLLITAEGQSGQGFRRIQQRVRLEASGYPMNLYIDGDVTGNGSPQLSNQSIYITGDYKGRSQLVINGSDLVYGGSASVNALGTIHDRMNQSSPIYIPEGQPGAGEPNPPNWDGSYIHDRDKNGPLGNTFEAEELQALFETGGLTTSQLLSLKGMAKTSGYYVNPESGNFNIQQADLPAYEGQSIVVYVEFSGGTPETNEVGIRFRWPNPFSSSSPGQAIVVVRNGSANMNGLVNVNGSLYCPNGSVSTDGNGGRFTGFVWGKGLRDIGNFDFSMSQAFLDDPPFFSWTVVRETAWSEVDR